MEEQGKYLAPFARSQLMLILTFPASDFFIHNQKRYSDTMPHRQATQTISSSLLYSSHIDRLPKPSPPLSSTRRVVALLPPSIQRANDVVVQVQLLQPRLEQSSR
jgi:hypothetical protein